MPTITINAEKRNISGKHVKTIRKQGKVPAVVYGHNVQTESLQINENDFIKVFRQAGESTIINLNIGGKDTPVLIHDVQNHYLTDRPVHVDFYAINMEEKLHASVPFHFIGESPAVKNLGGILIKNMSEVEVECLPVDLPPFIEIDISKMANLEDAVRIADLSVSDKVHLDADPDSVIVAVAPPRTEEEIKGLSEQPVAEDVSAVEGVIKPEAPVEGEAPAAEEKEAKKE